MKTNTKMEIPVISAITYYNYRSQYDIYATHCFIMSLAPHCDVVDLQVHNMHGQGQHKDSHVRTVQHCHTDTLTHANKPTLRTISLSSICPHTAAAGKKQE